MRYNDKGISTLHIILIVVAAMLALLAVSVFIWHFHSFTQVSGSDIPTEGQKAYFQQLEFAEVRMSAAENFLGASVIYMEARVKNRGTKTVRRLVLDLAFVDTLNQVVLRERVYPLTEHASPLKAGESKTFRITFEHMPPDWNQGAPIITPVYVQLE